MKCNWLWAVWLGVLVTVLLGACRPATGSGSARPEAPTRSVQLAVVKGRPLERVITVSGTLAAHEESTLSAKVAGRLQRVTVDLGSVVKEGDVLAQVEPRDFELRVQQSSAALGQARAMLGLDAEGDDDRVDLAQVSAVRQARALLEEAASSRERMQALSSARIASNSESDAVEAAWKVAVTREAVALEETRTRVAALAQRRAELELAKKQLADTSLRAPFDGVVQARAASVGEYVTTGTPIVTLVKPDPLRLRLEVPEREAAAVRVGQAVRVSVEGDTNTYGASVMRISPALTEGSRMLKIEADVARQGVLRAGLFARARIVVSESDHGLCIPADALLTFAGLEKVVLFDGGKAAERAVRTGRRGPDWVEIREGLKSGDRVVMHPAGLRSGQALTASEVPAGSGVVSGR